jgi:hypothetical protein
MDLSTHPPRVSKFSYDLWVCPDDAIVESFPCWMVTLAVQKEILSAGLTGVNFDHVDIVLSDQFKEFYPDVKLLEFVWMKVNGIPGRDDFGVRESIPRSGSRGPYPHNMFSLVVSERALDILRPLGLSHAEITPWELHEAADDQRK